MVLGRDVGARTSWVQLPAESLTQGKLSQVSWLEAETVKPGRQNHRSVLRDWENTFWELKKKKKKKDHSVKLEFGSFSCSLAGVLLRAGAVPGQCLRVFCGR